MTSGLFVRVSIHLHVQKIQSNHLKRKHETSNKVNLIKIEEKVAEELNIAYTFSVKYCSNKKNEASVNQ